MGYRSQIVKFTLWYWAGLFITGIADYIAFGSVAPDSVTTEILNLLSFAVASALVSTPHSISQAGLTVENAKSLPPTLAGWTFVLPWVELTFLVSFLFLVGGSEFSRTLLLTWLHASPLTIVNMVLGQTFDAIAVYIIVRQSLSTHLQRSASSP